MGNDRLHGAIGLSMKAGKCLSGDFVVERALRDGKVLLVLLDTEASAATSERYERLAARGEIPLLRVSSLGDAIGKPSRMIAAITDEGFRDMALRAAGAQNGN